MTSQNWIELPRLVESLYCSERTVYKLKKANVFIAGEHFYRAGEGKKKGKCIYGLEECRQALLKNSEDNTKKIKGARYSKTLLNPLLVRRLSNEKI